MTRKSRIRAALAASLAVATLGTFAAGVGVAGENDDKQRGRGGEREIAGSSTSGTRRS
ncbi:hypothetical protein [Streptomyces gardneri]|uniref:Uncharacterized protein n=1 Tax=Streptomyces gardneri TaxID=66892 RepID=A0A4Y3RKI2_9ACTN|nr:hypothetical protein SGA01_38410 [Streptomyces gardneri]GHH17286.1 hypothetical protein GCM10017674_68050 [Streptomyces gardneri]